jgi:hypothetical protein
MKKLVLAMLVVICSSGLAVANDATDDYVELLRSDLRADKQALVEYAMDLNEADAQIFWPIYRKYEAERIALADRTVALIKAYPGAVNVTDVQTVAQLGDEWFKIQEDRLKMTRKYYKQVSKQLAPRVAVRWIQVENRLHLLLNLQLAAEVPLVQPLGR